MKRLFWIVPMALTIAFGAMTLSAGPVEAQKGGEVRTRIALAGARINGIVAKGKAEFRTAARFRTLKAQAERVNLENGTVLDVAVNGIPAGSLTLSLGRGEMEISTKTGGTVPQIKAGDVVTVSTQAGMVVLQGKF